MNEVIKTLHTIKSGQSVRVKEITGGRRARNRLMELGIIEGTAIGVFSNEGGPLIIAVGNSRFAIGRGIAQKILVKTAGQS